MPLGNPYVVDRPLAQGDLFIGRYELLAEVAQGVRRGRQLVLVYGPARTGKTSFLRQLAVELSRDLLVVSVNFSWPDGGSPQQAVQELRAAVAREVSVALGQPAEDLAATAAALDGRGLAVLVDGASLSWLRGQTGADVVAEWQGWLTTMPSARLVVTVEGTADGAALFCPALASLPSVQLPSFGLQETEELLARSARGRLAYEFVAARRIWQLTSGHPYLVQLFGYVLFAAHPGAERIGVHDVEETVQQVINAADDTMERVWQGCPSQVRILLSLSNQLRGRHGILTVLDLRDAARQHGVALSVPDIEAGLNELLAAGVVAQLSPESYAFSSELFRAWLAERKPLSQTLRELKVRRHLGAPLASRGWRSLRLSSIVVWMAGLAVISAVVLLWNMRGAAQRLATGSSPTATPSPFATRATLMAGPALGRIAFMSRDSPDATWDVWLMRGDGSDPQRLTDDPADDMSPTWSPDGKSIAFVSERDGNREIYVMQADGTRQINLTQHASEDWTPSWSPDGQSIAFASYRDGNWEIYLMDSDGSDPVRLTEDSAADYGPCWSPDGQLIAFHSNRDGNWEIYIVSRDAQLLVRLTEDEATDFAPAWSPDGATVAFESYRDGNMEIYLMAADGSEQRNITNDPYSNEHGPSWARNGTKMLYFSNRDGGWDIFSMRPDGTEKSNLTLSLALEHGPEWHE